MWRLKLIQHHLTRESDFAGTVNLLFHYMVDLTSQSETKIKRKVFMKTLICLFLTSLATSAFARSQEVTCRSTSGTTSTVTFSHAGILFEKVNGDRLNVASDRVLQQETGLGFPGSNESVRAVKRILYSGSLQLADYTITEFDRSGFNHLSGEVVRLAEPELFARLVSERGLAKAIEISPWLLGLHACEVR